MAVKKKNPKFFLELLYLCELRLQRSENWVAPPSFLLPDKEFRNKFFKRVRFGGFGVNGTRFDLYGRWQMELNGCLFDLIGRRILPESVFNFLGRRQ